MPPTIQPKEEKVLRTVDEFMATDPATWEYVTIPKKDLLGYQHADMGLNRMIFRHGETYHLPATIAAFLRDRLEVYARACVRVLQPTRDIEAENAVPAGAARSVDAAAIR